MTLIKQSAASVGGEYKCFLRGLQLDALARKIYAICPDADGLDEETPENGSRSSADNAVRPSNEYVENMKPVASCSSQNWSLWKCHMVDCFLHGCELQYRLYGYMHPMHNLAVRISPIDSWLCKDVAEILLTLCETGEHECRLISTHRVCRGTVLALLECKELSLITEDPE
ncbi:hypothetical protein HPB50_003638 [Hyalomma asiaticum]|uniref:Uncharacterized protein n=1 Tax=Hyalomma asiaticum TaxID=266040 RepID=A0ACB7SHP2_HYAAI|nr:hypothetical protein HPB50_003638 [Hyalomma asiaticum]